MGTAQSSKQQMWNTTSSAYKFYGILEYTCTRNDRNGANTYTVTLNKLKVHGKDWNFTVYYSITIGGRSYTGNIGKTNDPTGELWIEGPLNISYTLDGDANGHCPPLKLDYTVYNNDVYYINAGKHVKCSSSYSGDISGTVESESKGPNNTWGKAGGATVKSITENPDEGTAVVVTEMGADGKNNKVSDVHLYYSFSNTNPQYKGADVYGLSNGAKSDRTVTFTIPYSTVKERTTIYARAFSISQHEDNPGGNVFTANLLGWEQCGGAIVESITDNGNNTFNVVAKTGKIGKNNTATGIDIYYSFVNSDPQSGGSNCKGELGRFAKADYVHYGDPSKQVTFRNIPFTASGKVFVAAHIIAAKGGNHRGAVKSETLTYYDKPVISAVGYALSKNTGLFKITELTNQSEWLYAITDAEQDLKSLDDDAWKTYPEDGIELTLEPNKVNTRYIQVRRKHWAECRSNILKVEVDLRCAVVHKFQLIDTTFDGKGTFIIGAGVSKSNERIRFKIKDTSSKQVIHVGALASGSEIQVKTSQLNVLDVGRYELEVYRTSWPFLNDTAILRCDVRETYPVDITLTSGVVSSIEAPLTPLENKLRTLKLSFKTVDAYRYLHLNEERVQSLVSQVQVKLTDTTPHCQPTSVIFEEIITTSNNNISLELNNLKPGHTYKLDSIKLKCKSSSRNRTTTMTDLHSATVSGSVSIVTNSKAKLPSNKYNVASVWIYHEGTFKNAVPYIYKAKTNTWYRVKV